MTFLRTSRRKSSSSSYSSLSTSSSSTSLDKQTLSMTLPIAPREDDYNMSEEVRRQRLLAKCNNRKAREPWKSAKPLPASSSSSSKE